MKKWLVALMTGAATLLFASGATNAAYPPFESAGTVDNLTSDCRLERDEAGQVRVLSRSITIDYSVTAAEAELFVDVYDSPEGGPVTVWTKIVPRGTGSLTLSSDNAEFDWLVDDGPIRAGLRAIDDPRSETLPISRCPSTLPSGSGSGSTSGSTKISAAAGSSLPSTGADSLVLALVALGLLGAGTTLVRLSRHDDASVGN